MPLTSTSLSSSSSHLDELRIFDTGVGNPCAVGVQLYVQGRPTAHIEHKGLTSVPIRNCALCLVLVVVRTLLLDVGRVQTIIRAIVTAHFNDIALCDRIEIETRVVTVEICLVRVGDHRHVHDQEGLDVGIVRGRQVLDDALDVVVV
jgi:hypothetical protein